jgi:ATP-dependent protease Clp ATPase subunit
VMYDAPDNNDVVHVKITRSVVLGESQPIVRRKPDMQAA